MKRDIFTNLFTSILLFNLILLIGCGTATSLYETGTSTAKSVYSKVTDRITPGEKSGLKKKVLVLSVMDQAGIGKEKAEQITATMVELLKEDKQLIVHKATTPMPPTAKIRSPYLGIVIDPELAHMSEEMGMNVLITSILSPFEVHLKKSGIWPLQKIRREIEISMVVNVLDITNGTLFLTNLESGKIKTSEDISEDQEGEKEIIDSILAKELSPILENHASAIKRVLRNQPWTGRLLSASGNTIMINAGKDVGVTEGSVFEVFGEGESIRSASGKILYILGPKVGEIKTAEVMQDYSSAIPLAGEEFKAGQVIKLKN